MLMPVLTYRIVGFGLLAVVVLVALLLSISPSSPLSPSSRASSFGVTHGSLSTKPLWLLATLCPAHGYQRRELIRATWQKTFRNDTLFETKFVISNPGPYRPLIEHEQKTYGDLIVLDHLRETDHTANTIKSMKFFEWLVNQGEKWTFVTKIDDDSYVDPNRMYHEYLLPVLWRNEQPPKTIIARQYYNHGRVVPAGQFYTMTWDIVELLVKLFRANPIVDDNEDTVVGRLLYEAREKWRFVILPQDVSHDYNDDHGAKINGTQTAWAPEGENLDQFTHGISPLSINPHKLKSDELYLRVNECYGPDGVKEYPSELLIEEPPQGDRKGGHD